MCGFLQKKGGMSFGIASLQSWKQRFFRLVGPILVYTEKETDEQIKDSFLLHPGVIVQGANYDNAGGKEQVNEKGEKKGGEGNNEDRKIVLINVPTNGNSLILVANNTEDQKRWCIALSNVVTLLCEGSGKGNGDGSPSGVDLYRRCAASEEWEIASKERQEKEDFSSLSSLKQNDSSSELLGWVPMVNGKIIGAAGGSSGQEEKSHAAVSQGLASRHSMISLLNFKCGTLQKKGGASMGISALQTWKNRSFVLCGLCLTYSEEAGGVTKDCWNLTDCKVTIDENQTWGEKGGRGGGGGNEVQQRSAFVMVSIALNRNIASNVSSSSTVVGVLTLRATGVTHSDALSNAHSWKHAIDSNTNAVNIGRIPTIAAWRTSRTSEEWSMAWKERLEVDQHVQRFTSMRTDEYDRLVREEMNPSSFSQSTTTDTTHQHSNEMMNSIGISLTPHRHPLIPPSPSRPPPTPGKLITRRPSILGEEDDDEEEDVAPEKGQTKHINANTPELTSVLEKVMKRRGISADVSFFDIVWQKKNDGSAVYRQRRMLVVTGTHLLTYKKRSSKNTKKWIKCKTIKLKNIYRMHHANTGKMDISEVVTLRTRQSISMMFLGPRMLQLHVAIQNVAGLVHQHPGNVWRAEPVQKDKSSMNNNEMENEEKNENEDLVEQDMGAVSDSYQNGVMSDNEDEEGNDTRNTASSSVAATSSSSPSSSSLASSASFSALAVGERHVVDCMGALAATARLKSIGEIFFCGLVLQDKSQGWKQRRVVVVTDTRLLTFKLKSSAGTVRLSKNIPLSSIQSSRRKEQVGGDRGEGVVIVFLLKKNVTFDFEGKGCHALLKVLTKDTT